MQKPVLKTIIACAICAFTSQAIAYEGVKYSCGDDDFKRIVYLFDAENRVQITSPAETFAAVSDLKGGFLNVFHEAQFYPKPDSARLYLASEQIECVKGDYAEKPTKPPKLSIPPAPQPIDGQSLGGKVRDGAGMHAQQIASLYEGNALTIISNTGENMNGYDWFKIEFKNGQTGYQWGGIMCSSDKKIDGIYQQCK